MPRTGMGSIAPSRVSISLAALLVKVTAITPPGESWPVWICQAMRVVNTRVLPEPAPARISAGRAGNVTAASCSGLRCCSSGELTVDAGSDSVAIFRLSATLPIARSGVVHHRRRAHRSFTLAELEEDAGGQRRQRAHAEVGGVKGVHQAAAR